MKETRQPERDRTGFTDINADMDIEYQTCPLLSQKADATQQYAPFLFHFLELHQAQRNVQIGDNTKKPRVDFALK